MMIDILLVVHACMVVFPCRLHIDGMDASPDHYGEVSVSVALYNKTRSYREVYRDLHNFRL